MRSRSGNDSIESLGKAMYIIAQYDDLAEFRARNDSLFIYVNVSEISEDDLETLELYGFEDYQKTGNSLECYSI